MVSLKRGVLSSAVLVMLLSACSQQGQESSPVQVSQEASEAPSEGLSGFLTGEYQMLGFKASEGRTDGEEKVAPAPSPSPSSVATTDGTVVAQKEDDLAEREENLGELKDYTGLIDSRGFEFTSPVTLYSPGNLNHELEGQVLQTWTTNKNNPEAEDAVIVLAQVKPTDARNAWEAIKEFPDAGGQGGSRNISNLAVPGAESAIEVETPGDSEGSRARTILAYADGRAYLLGASGQKSAWEAHTIDRIFASFQIER